MSFVRESRKATEVRLKREGRWKGYVDRREALKKEGKSPKRARVMALEEYQPLEREIIDGEVVQVVACTDQRDKGGRKGDFADKIRRDMIWAYEHYADMVPAALVDGKPVMDSLGKAKRVFSDPMEAATSGKSLALVSAREAPREFLRTIISMWIGPKVVTQEKVEDVGLELAVKKIDQIMDSYLKDKDGQVQGRTEVSG